MWLIDPVRPAGGKVVAEGSVDDVLGRRGEPHGELVRAASAPMVRDADDDDDDEAGDDDGGVRIAPGERRRQADLEGTPMPEIIRRRQP